MRRFRPAPLVAATALALVGCASETSSGTTRPTDPSTATPTATSLTTIARADTAPTSAPPTTSTAATTTPERAVAPTTVPTAPPTTAASVERCAADLSVREQAALVTWPAVVTDDWETALHVVGDLGVGGVLLMEPGDDVSVNVLADLLTQLHAASARGVLVATDEEGGSVQRLRKYRPLPSQADVSTDLSPEEASALVADHGAFVADLGIDVVLGPVVDVAPVDGEPALDASRFFAGTPVDVAEYASAYIEGWAANGLIATIKHFPGHGSASADTHDDAAVTPPLDQLEARDLVPYRMLVGPSAPRRTAVMVGHLTVPGSFGDGPAASSAEAIEFLRDDLGHGDGLVISDALGMGAVELPLPEAAVASIAAGVDALLFTDTAQTASVIDALVAAVADGTIAAERLESASARVACVGLA